LVVIAIIGILAAMILVALNTARSKAKDARVKSDIGQYALDAVAYGDTNAGNMSGWCVATPDASKSALAADVTLQGGGTIPLTPTLGTTTTAGCGGSTVVNGGTWAVSAVLNGGGVTICTDSTGKTQSGSVASAAGVCSAGTAL